MYVATNKNKKRTKIRKKTWGWFFIEPGQVIESSEPLIGFDGVEIKNKAKKEVKNKNGS